MRPRLRRSRLSTQHEKHQGHPFDCPSWPSAAVPFLPSLYSAILSAILVAIPRAIPLLVEGVREQMPCPYKNCVHATPPADDDMTEEEVEAVVLAN